ncbi:hypothetical protein ONZ45_g6774 [Pleurotus djamor]|nr:hypothetical protein ONZ45_g6774 [Pleurotus djamor]
METLVQQIVGSNNLKALDNALRNSLPKETRESTLASLLPGGQDPLNLLDLRVNTLGVLYILSARLTVPSVPIPSPMLIQSFCRVFDPDQAYIAPARVTLLAKGIMRVAEENHDPRWAIEPLHDLLTRYTPSPSHLTPLHPLFVLLCAQTHCYTAALPILETPITSIDMSVTPDLTYLDNLVYHYIGGMILAVLKQWERAEEYFEICVTSPAQVPAAVQLEALKKLVLVQLIWQGKTSSLPKYANPQLSRMLKATPYNSFINAYPRSVSQLQTTLDKEKAYFATEKNTGLLQQALARAPRWSIKKLTETYVTLSISEIAKAVKVDDEALVHSIILDMIDSDDINAKISVDGTVTFSDAPTGVGAVTKADVDKMLLDAQEQANLLQLLDLELGKNKEYLTKVLKAKDDPWAAPAGEDEIFNLMNSSNWEETNYS